MTRISRRSFLAGSVAVTAAGFSAPRVHAQKRGGTLRFVPHADLKVLDPIWTTAYITRNHGYMIYDTLFALDANLQIRPQMVEKHSVSKDGMKYSFTLRDGLKFHDGQPVTADDCVASIKRWGARDAVGRLMMAAVGRLAPVDRKTFALELAQPFGLVLDGLAKPSACPCFIMPARIAATDPNEQVKETIGSGPYRFIKDEWQPGNQVVYTRNADYVPRSEAPSGAAGDKRVFVDRVVWRYIPDAATANAALAASEIDYWENPPLDFVPPMERNPNLTVFVTDPRGTQGLMRPNHLQPPFNNRKARQALLWMVDQEQYLKAAIGQARYYRPCPGYFMCGGLPYESTVAAPSRPDSERARQLLKESGYDGSPVVLMDPTDIALLHGASLVCRELLQKVGFNVDLQSMDWSTLVARRAKKEALKDGGWNLFHTWAISSDTMTPAVNSAIAGSCDKAWFGWPCSETMERLRADFARTTDPTRRKQLAEEIQKVAFDEVPYVPWGQWVLPSAYRKNVRGVLQFGAQLLWNIEV
ncbi:MAG TPA: ABC transporter substrate-binding protein [Methylomirabilota bacterium]